ncbi:MAG: two-component system response regulator, partial [Hydrocarboniphaga effusa]|nr:two-component system response regulator [Hydrocarboniphaga effusa]
GRIVAVADVFDALLSKRPYKHAWPVEEVVAYLQRESGRHFDPSLVPKFVDLLPEMRVIMRQYSEQAGKKAMQAPNAATL